MQCLSQHSPRNATLSVLLGRSLLPCSTSITRNSWAVESLESIHSQKPSHCDTERRNAADPCVFLIDGLSWLLHRPTRHFECKVFWVPEPRLYEERVRTLLSLAEDTAGVSLMWVQWKLCRTPLDKSTVVWASHMRCAQTRRTSPDSSKRHGKWSFQTELQICWEVKG